MAFFVAVVASDLAEVFLASALLVLILLRASLLLLFPGGVRIYPCGWGMSIDFLLFVANFFFCSVESFWPRSLAVPSTEGNLR